MKKIFLLITLIFSFIFLSLPLKSFAAENIHIDSAEWLNSTTIRFHYSDNTYAPGGITLAHTASDGSRTLHAGAADYPITETEGYVDFDAGSDVNALYFGAESGYTRYFALVGWGDPENMSNTIRLEEYSEQAATIGVSPSTSDLVVGQSFVIDIFINSGEEPFNAARASVDVSSNLSVTAIQSATSEPCNLNYTQSPSTSDPSFAGAILGGNSTICSPYRLVVTPTEVGTGTITITNASLKAYSDNSELLDDVENGSYDIGVGATPTPTPLLEFTIDNIFFSTYDSEVTLFGEKLESITNIFVDGSDEDSSYPTSTSWEVPVEISLGANTFTLYGSDGTNQTATQSITINRHTLGDINGDEVIDIIDVSLFAVDWDKTEDLVYDLSDMDGDGDVDLTDLSILAKLVTE